VKVGNVKMELTVVGHVFPVPLHSVALWQNEAYRGALRHSRSGRAVVRATAVGGCLATTDRRHIKARFWRRWRGRGYNCLRLDDHGSVSALAAHSTSIVGVGAVKGAQIGGHFTVVRAVVIFIIDPEAAGVRLAQVLTDTNGRHG
jgi:hypothetical protein